MTDAPQGAWAASIRHLPNALTVARILLIIPAGWLLWIESIPEALIVIGVAGASDFIDGELARRFDWRTNFGAIADPAADKLLVLVVLVVLVAQSHVPLWLAVLVIGRDVVIVFGALAYRLVLGSFEVEPSRLSKANTGLLVVVLLMVIVGLMGEEVPFAAQAAALVDPLGFGLVGISSVVSGGHYVLLWSLRARTNLRVRQEQTP